jgi:hypothetical protein
MPPEQVVGSSIKTKSTTRPANPSESISTSAAVRFVMLIHHADAEREYNYDRYSHFGRLDVALDLAPTNHWTIVDMKRDWKVIFYFPSRKSARRRSV